MAETRTVISALWVALMLTYLLGDVLRIFAGDVELGKMNGVAPRQGTWLGISAIMLIPILMVVLRLVVPYPAIQWINIVVLFNLAGLPYK